MSLKLNVLSRIRRVSDIELDEIDDVIQKEINRRNNRNSIDAQKG
jgi:hypothetical protein